MIESIVDIFNKVKEAITTIIDQVGNLPERINSITFDENSVITRFLALIHYVLGTPLYTLFCLTLLIGAGFILYHIGKTIIDVIGSIIPKLKGRFIIP